jgi:DedD protein
VALAVIFIPMLLDETQPPPDLKGAPEIPERPASAETKVVVKPVMSPDAKDKDKPEAPAAAEPTKEPAPEPKADSAGEAIKPAAPVEQADTKAAAAQPSKPQITDKAEKAATRGWVVQVGVYSNPDNAARVVSRLKSHGHAVREEHIKIATGAAVRLRVGPYRDKATAQKARDQIARDVGEKAAVLPYP